MRKPKGFTLAEVLISILLVAIAVLSVFSVQLATRVQTKKTSMREQAAHYNRSLQEHLKNFVKPADPAAQMLSFGAPGSPAWHLAGDDCGTPGDASDTCWALHDLGGAWHDATLASRIPNPAADDYLLPSDFRAAPYNGTMKYRVAIYPVDGKPVRKVEISIRWDEAGQ